MAHESKAPVGARVRSPLGGIWARGEDRWTVVAADGSSEDFLDSDENFVTRGAVRAIELLFGNDRRRQFVEGFGYRVIAR